jgi:hypothetical protein
MGTLANLLAERLLASVLFSSPPSSTLTFADLRAIEGYGLGQSLAEIR